MAISKLEAGTFLLNAFWIGGVPTLEGIQQFI